MDNALFFAMVLGFLALAFFIGGLLTERRRKPMARYVRADILPPPSSQCERPWFREHA